MSSQAKYLSLLIRIVLAVAVAFFTGELTVRVAGLSKTWNGRQEEQLHARIIEKHYSKEAIGFRYLPSSNFTSIRDKTYVINQAGFRDLEFKLKKVNPRIAFIGDSVIEGLGVDAKDRATNRARAALAATLKKKVDIYNFGVGAFSTYDELAVLENHVVSYKPDYAVLQICFNDLQRNYDIAHFEGDTVSKPDVSQPSLKAFFQKHSAFYLFLAEKYDYQRLRNGSPNSLLDNVIVERDEQWMLLSQLIARFRDVCQDSGIHPIIMYIPLEPEVLVDDAGLGTITSSRIESICKELKIANINSTQALRMQESPGELYNDHYHLSENGHAVVADCIVAFFKRRLGGG